MHLINTMPVHGIYEGEWGIADALGRDWLRPQRWTACCPPRR